MAYNLWLAEYKAIQNYYSRRLDSRQLSSQIAFGDTPDDLPLSLMMDGEGREELTLDEIDSFTCCFKNLDALRRELRKYPEYRKYADRSGTLMIASRSDNIGKYRVIYHNQFLKDCADTIRRKRKHKEPLYLDRNPELEKFVRKIADYAVSQETGISLINFTILPPHVLNCIRNYRISILEKTGFDSKYLEMLSSYCSNYKTLRAFVVWEQDYLEMRRERIAQKRAENKEIRDEISKILLYGENLRRSPYASPIMEDIDGMRDEYGQLDLDRVYSIYDIDDIHSHSEKALQQIGILPVDFSEKEIKKNDGTTRKIH